MITPVKYVRTRTISGAISAYESSSGPAYIAGGTDLVVRMRDGRSDYGTLIDVSGIPELSGVRIERGKVFIGAGTAISEMGGSRSVRAYSAIEDSITVFGTPQIRNLATVGGNLCNASPAADMAPPLIVLGAEVILAGPSGKRRINVEDFFAGPGKSVLKPGEIAQALVLPELPGGSSFIKFGRRRASTLSILSAASYVEMDKGKIRALRLSLGASAPTPVRARNAEDAAIDTSVDKAVEAAAKAVKEDISPISDQRASSEYRKRLAPVLVVRAIKFAASRAGWKG